MQRSFSMNRWQRSWRILFQSGNHDFCPGLNQYVYWLKKPIGWFSSAAFVALLLGLFGETEAFAVAGALVGLVLLGIVWPAIAVRCVSAKLSWRRSRCEEGESLETILDVVNRWPWRVWGLMVESDEALVNGGDGQKESVSLASVPALAKSRFVWHAIPQQRGEYPQRSAQLTSGYPFGLWMAKRPLSFEQTILVWPKTMELGDLPSYDGQERSVVGAWIDRAGMDGDVIGVRPYREGDSLRHVHWAQSARHDSLIVCERQSVARRSLQLEIFPVAVESLFPDGLEVREWLVRIGGSVARTFLSHHWSVQVNVERLSVNAEPGTQGLHRMLDGLARMKWNAATGVSSTTVDSSPFSSTAKHVARNRNTASDHLLSLGIADAATYAKCMRSGKFNSFRWIVVDKLVEFTHEFAPSANVWFTVNVDQPVWAQLRQRWSSVCRNANTASPHSNVCLCDA
jgi:uncharacterized protein (DUF58 family)